MAVQSSSHGLTGAAMCLALALASCGGVDPPDATGPATDPSRTSTTTAPPTTAPATTVAPTNPVDPADDPYGVLRVQWPSTLGHAARLLDRLPAALDHRTRTPVFASNNWFLIGNIPILANADESGRVLTGFFDDADPYGGSVAIAQPSTAPAWQLGGFLTWGGAPEHCPDAEGSTSVIDGDLVDMDALMATDTGRAPVWVACTMQQNPDSDNDVETPENWAYGFGWTTAEMAWFVAAGSLAERDALVEALIAAAASNAPPSDPSNPLFDVEGPQEWWPGGVLLNCAYSDDGSGVIRYDPVTRSTDVLFESNCNRVSVSPDGTHVVVDGYSGVTDTMHLSISDLDGGNARILTDPPRGDAPIDGDAEATWSPTGEWIAFQRHGDRIHVIRPDGTGLRFVTEGRAPRWSPDGNMLLVRGNDEVLAVQVSDGSTRFTIPGTLDAAWSPDGTTIAYERDGQLRMWSPEVGDLGAVEGLDVLGEIQSPLWSPDGEWILVESGAFATVIVDPVGGTVHRIGPRPGDDGFTFTTWVDS